MVVIENDGHLTLKAGKTNISLLECAELVIQQTRHNKTTTSSTNDHVGNYLFAALARFIYETSGHFPNATFFNENPSIGEDCLSQISPLKMLIETPVPFVQNENQILGTGHFPSLYIISPPNRSNESGNTFLYARDRNTFQIFRKKQEKETQKKEKRFCTKYTDHEGVEKNKDWGLFSLVAEIDSSEAKTVMTKIYQLHQKGEINDQRYCQNTLDQLLNYAQKKVH